MTPDDRLRSVSSEYSMPANAKLDALGIDLDVTTLPTWGEIDATYDRFIVPAVKDFSKRLAHDAMWRAAQQLAQVVTQTQKDNVTNWRPVSELTPEIVTGTRRMLVQVFGGEIYLLDGGVSEGGCILEYDDNDKWAVFVDNWMAEFRYVKWFVVIDAPPEGT